MTQRQRELMEMCQKGPWLSVDEAKRGAILLKAELEEMFPKSTWAVRDYPNNLFEVTCGCISVTNSASEDLIVRNSLTQPVKNGGHPHSFILRARVMRLDWAVKRAVADTICYLANRAEELGGINIRALYPDADFNQTLNQLTKQP